LVRKTHTHTLFFEWKLIFSVAPICFVFEDPIHLYFIFRQFYMKYFFNLHHISASPNVRKWISFFLLIREEIHSSGNCWTVCLIWIFITANLTRTMVSFTRYSSSTVGNWRRNCCPIFKSKFV
jgi:hypothetical protein